MTGSQYAALYRRSVEDLRTLAEKTAQAAAQLLGHPSVAEDHLHRAEQSTDPAERRRLYIAAFRDAQAETQQIPGNDLLGDVFEITRPSDLKNEIEELKASYDIVNTTAKGRQDWDLHYQEFLRFYEQNRNPGFFSSSDSLKKTIRNRAQRLEEWKKRLSSEGISVREPEKKQPPPPPNQVKNTIDSATILLGVGVGGLLLWKLAK